MKKLFLYAFAAFIALATISCGDENNDGPVNVPVIPEDKLVFPFETDFKWDYRKHVNWQKVDTVSFKVEDIFDKDGNKLIFMDKNYLKPGKMVIFNDDYYGYASSAELSDRLNLIKYPATQGAKIINGTETTDEGTINHVAQIVDLDAYIEVPKKAYTCVVVNLYNENSAGIKDTTFEQFLYLSNRVGLVKLTTFERKDSTRTVTELELIDYNFSASM